MAPFFIFMTTAYFCKYVLPPATWLPESFLISTCKIHQIKFSARLGCQEHEYFPATIVLDIGCTSPSSGFVKQSVSFEYWTCVSVLFHQISVWVCQQTANTWTIAGVQTSQWPEKKRFSCLEHMWRFDTELESWDLQTDLYILRSAVSRLSKLKQFIVE